LELDRAVFERMQTNSGNGYCGFANGFCVYLQRRRAERQQRSKKVGVRYYETHNVKNKNKNKKKTGLEEQRSKHKKYKHKQ